MNYKKRNNVTEVTFTYVGTDEQFNDFLKLVLHDYFAADHPYATQIPAEEEETTQQEQQKWQQSM